MFAAYFGMMNYARIEIQVTTSLFFRIFLIPLGTFGVCV